MQVTYGGQPVYWFFKDKAGGKATGNITDKWGKWTDVTLSKGSSGSSGSGSGSSGNSRRDQRRLRRRIVLMRRPDNGSPEGRALW